MASIGFLVRFIDLSISINFMVSIQFDQQDILAASHYRLHAKQNWALLNSIVLNAWEILMVKM